MTEMQSWNKLMKPKNDMLKHQRWHTYFRICNIHDNSFYNKKTIWLLTSLDIILGITFQKGKEGDKGRAMVIGGGQAWKQYPDEYQKVNKEASAPVLQPMDISK